MPSKTSPILAVTVGRMCPACILDLDGVTPENSSQQGSRLFYEAERIGLRCTPVLGKGRPWERGWGCL